MTTPEIKCLDTYAVLIEVNTATTVLRIDFDVDLGQRFVLIFAQHSQLTNVLHHVHCEGIAIIRLIDSN